MNMYYSVLTNGSIIRRVFAFLRIWTAATVITFVDFFLPSVLISTDKLSVLEVECLAIRASEFALFIYLEID